MTKEFAAPGERVTSLAWRTAPPPGGSDSPPEGSSPSGSGSSSGRWLAVGYASGAVRVFDVDAAALVAERFFFRRERDAFFPVDALAFAADGASLFAAGADASVCVFRCDETLFGDERVVPAKTLALAPARPNARTKYPRASLAASPDGGSRVAVAGPRGDRVLVFDAATLKLAGPTIRVADGRCTALAFAPDSESLFVASESDSDGGASTTLARYPVKRDDAFSPSDDDSEDPSERQSSVSDALRVAAARREADALLFGARQAVARAVAKVSGRVSALATDPATAASCSRGAVARWRRRPSRASSTRRTRSCPAGRSGARRARGSPPRSAGSSRTRTRWRTSRSARTEADSSPSARGATRSRGTFSTTR